MKVCVGGDLCMGRVVYMGIHNTGLQLAEHNHCCTFHPSVVQTAETPQPKSPLEFTFVSALLIFAMHI